MKVAGACFVLALTRELTTGVRVCERSRTVASVCVHIAGHVGSAGCC